MPYTVIDGFRMGEWTGLSTFRNPPGSLTTAENVHVSNLGTLEKRDDIMMLEQWDSNSEYDFYGLVATADKLFVFGSNSY